MINKYKQRLDENYKSYSDMYDSKLDFIGGEIFNFTTYESEVSEYLAKKMLEVCEAILNTKTYDYIEEFDNRINYITMVNMPFLRYNNMIEWGISIRGAWFNNYENDKDLKFNDIIVPRKDLKVFIADLIEWSKNG